MKPNPDIALIYHYDLARALDGEAVDWQAIPVNVQAGRDGGDLCRAAADFAKRRDLFAMPAPAKIATGEGIPAGSGATPSPVAPVAAPVPVPNRAVEQRAATSPPIGLVPVAMSAATPERERDVMVYGFCWCGEPRRAEVVKDPNPNYPGGRLSRLVCYVGHDDHSGTVPVAMSAANPHKLRARIAELVAAGHEQMMRRHWPADVPTLKHDGHSDDELRRILAAVRSVEALVGASWHPDDGAQPVTPRSRTAT